MAINQKTGKRLDPRNGRRVLPPYFNADNDKAPTPPPDERAAIHPAMDEVLRKNELYLSDEYGIKIGAALVNRQRRGMSGEQRWVVPDSPPPALPDLDLLTFTFDLDAPA